MTLRIACLLWLLWPVAGWAQLQPERPGQETSISRVVFSAHRLWLLTDAGSLSTLEEGASHATPVSLPEPVLDLWRQGGTTVVVTGARHHPRMWSIRRLVGDAFSVVTAVPTLGEEIIAAGPSGTGVVLLTSRRMIELNGATSRQTRVHWVPGRDEGGVPVVFATPTAVYVGRNAGEFGGGLRRIDRRTGRVEDLRSAIGGGLCAGPLNPDCDPVTALAPMPGKPRCIAASIGLVHMLSHGRIIEICDRAVRRLYLKAQPGEWGQKIKDGEPVASVPFFGLVANDAELWALGTNGIHRIDADGAAKVTPLPALRPVGNLLVSFELPGVVLVGTSVNQRLSVSGMVPLMATK